jgi:hypothetical protein
MKAVASIAFLCLLAASCTASKLGERESKNSALRRLDNGEHVRSFLGLIVKLMYAGTKQLNGLRSAAPTTTPVTANAAEPVVQERAPKEPKQKKAAKQNELEGAGEVAKKAKKTKAPTSAMPSDVPSYAPSFLPSDAPSFVPSDVPSSMPSDAPSIEPTGKIEGFIRCETIYACNSGGILGATNDGFWMSKLNRDGVTCETTCTLPVSIAPRKVLGWTCGSKCAV